MSAVQMNIRLDSALKASGNAVIAELGYTPSQVVRALWEFATVQGTCGWRPSCCWKYS